LCNGFGSHYKCQPPSEKRIKIADGQKLADFLEWSAGESTDVPI